MYRRPGARAARCSSSGCGTTSGQAWTRRRSSRATRARRSAGLDHGAGRGAAPAGPDPASCTSRASTRSSPRPPSWARQLARRGSAARRDGVTGFWYGKAPGLDRAGRRDPAREHRGHRPRGGAVALVGDDPTAKSSTLPSACEPLSPTSLMPVLVPRRRRRDRRARPARASRCRAGRGLWVGAEDRRRRRRRRRAPSTVSRDWADPAVVERHCARRERYRHEPRGRCSARTSSEPEQSLDDVRLPLARAAYAAAHRPQPADRVRAAATGSAIVAAGKSLPRRAAGAARRSASTTAGPAAAAASGCSSSACCGRSSRTHVARLRGRARGGPRRRGQAAVPRARRSRRRSTALPDAPARRRQAATRQALRCSRPRTTLDAERRCGARAAGARAGSRAALAAEPELPRQRVSAAAAGARRRTSARAARTTPRPRCPTGPLVGGRDRLPHHGRCMTRQPSVGRSSA